MDICDAYHADKNLLGEIGVCWGTKERKACSCQGDKMKCDFYPKTDICQITTSVAHYTLDLGNGTIRAKPIITNADRIRAMTDEELAEWIAGDVLNLLGGAMDLSARGWLDWLKQEAGE